MITHLATPNVKGQIVIPVAMRRRLGIRSDTTIKIELGLDTITLTPTKRFDRVKFLESLKKLYDTYKWSLKDEGDHRAYRKREKIAALKSRDLWS